MDDGRWMIAVERTRAPLARRAHVARTLGARLTGLLGRESLPEGDALVFPACRSIHTFGMRFPIDVVFIDRRWRVVALRPFLGPSRLVPPQWRAWGVVETAAGSITRAGLMVGDQLRLLEGDSASATHAGASAEAAHA